MTIIGIIIVGAIGFALGILVSAAAVAELEHDAYIQGKKDERTRIYKELRERGWTDGK